MWRFSQERDALWRLVIEGRLEFITGDGVLWCECLEVYSKEVG
jgi:hypothetical protein